YAPEFRQPLLQQSLHIFWHGKGKARQGGHGVARRGVKCVGPVITHLESCRLAQTLFASMVKPVLSNAHSICLPPGYVVGRWWCLGSVAASLARWHEPK